MTLSLSNEILMKLLYSEGGVIVCGVVLVVCLCVVTCFSLTVSGLTR